MTPFRRTAQRVSSSTREERSWSRRAWVPPRICRPPSDLTGTMLTVDGFLPSLSSNDVQLVMGGALRLSPPLHHRSAVCLHDGASYVDSADAGHTRLYTACRWGAVVACAKRPIRRALSPIEIGLADVPEAAHRG